MGRLNPSRKTKFSGTHGDRGILIFPVQLTTSWIGNLTRLIHTLLYVMTIHAYIHTYTYKAEELLVHAAAADLRSDMECDRRPGQLLLRRRAV